MSMYGKYKGITKPLEPKDWPTTDCSKDVRLTSQAPREQVDINTIVKRMEAGQMLDSRILREGVYADVSDMGDLAESIQKVQKAWDDFMELPASVREKFDNNPTKLIDFLNDEKNRDEAVALGIVNEKAGEPATIPPAAGEEKTPE